MPKYSAEAKPVEVNGYKAMIDVDGNYWLHKPNGEFYSFVPASYTRDQVIAMFKEDSGENYRNLPAVKRDEIKAVHGELIKGFAGSWHKNTQYYFGEKLLGSICSKRKFLGKRFGHRFETLSGVGNTCVRGSDLAWICKENGLRLID